MKILFYSIKKFEKSYLLNENSNHYIIEFTEKTLSVESIELAFGIEIISISTNDDASKENLHSLFLKGVRFITVRATGYDNVDVSYANKIGLKVTNVQVYSPNAIAEHTIGLMLALNRKLMTAYTQTHNYNFTLDELIGFNLIGKTIGIIGTGEIGSIVAKILHGFGCKIIAYDIVQNLKLHENYQVNYTSMETLCSEADIITIHIPLNPETKYLIKEELIGLMKKKVMIINTARGAIVNTNDIIKYLKNGHIGYYGADVYENERGVFFNDLSITGLKDKNLATLLEMKNVLITPHQAFATDEAIKNIARITFNNIESYIKKETLANEVKIIVEKQKNKQFKRNYGTSNYY